MNAQVVDMIVVADGDNVATALHELASGIDVHVAGPSGQLPPLGLGQEIRLGHKVALQPIPRGDLVIKHGRAIGRATADIAIGEHVHVHNVISLSRETDVVPTDEAISSLSREKARDLSLPTHAGRTGQVPRPARNDSVGARNGEETFLGFARADGQIGIRNRLLVLFTVVCAEEVSRRIAYQLEDAVVAGWRDCLTNPGAQQKMLRLAANPNVGAVLVMSLGCECSDAPDIAEQIRATGKPVELVSIQAAGGTRAAIAAGVEKARALQALPVERKPLVLHDLIVGVECGGSDTTSGIAANPALGYAADKVITAGGTVIFEETNELLGCESALVEQAATAEVGGDILVAIRLAREWGARTGQRAISAGNIEGGLTTIEEKSLGAVCKAGTTPIVGVLHGGEWEQPRRPGLHLLAPYYVRQEGWTGGGSISDPNGVTELAACGAHLVVFTTGRGTVTGSGIVPVIKVCGNPQTYARMSENMDVNAGAIITGERTLADVGEEIFARIRETAQGMQTKNEELGHFEFHI